LDAVLLVVPVAFLVGDVADSLRSLFVSGILGTGSVGIGAVGAAGALTFGVGNAGSVSGIVGETDSGRLFTSSRNFWEADVFFKLKASGGVWEVEDSALFINPLSFF